MTPWSWVVAQVTQICMTPAAAQLPDSNKATGWGPDPGPLWALVATWATDYYTDPGCSRTPDSGMVLGSSLGLDEANSFMNLLKFRKSGIIGKKSPPGVW